MPHLDTILKLAVGLSISPGDLIKGVVLDGDQT